MILSVFMTMTRKPQCFATSDNTWMAMLYKKNTNSINVTVPRLIVKKLGLRPGMTAKLYIEVADDNADEEDP